MVSARALGLLMVVVGLGIGVSYAYLVLYTSPEVALLILRVTAAITALVLGSLVAGVGLALIIGWREFEESKARREERV